MAQVIRRNEILKSLRRAAGDTTSVVGVSRASDAPLDRLLAVAERSTDDLDRVALMLAAVADAADRLGEGGTLPASEHKAWESVGAKFKDRDALVRSATDMARAFADLIRNSVRGDAAMATLLGVDRSRISQRVTEHSLYAFDAGEQRCFPRWQLQAKRPLPGLKEVLTSFDPSIHPLTVNHWFQTANSDLLVHDEAVSPAIWLATGGDPKEAAALARDL